MLTSGIDHRSRGGFEVVEQRLANSIGQLQRVDGRPHMPEPGVALPLADDERLVTQAKPGMASLLRVRRRSAPVLDEEEGQPFGRSGQVLFGVDGAQDRIAGNSPVEGLDQATERLLAAGGGVDVRYVHSFTGHEPHCGARPHRPKLPFHLADKPYSLCCPTRLRPHSTHRRRSLRTNLLRLATIAATAISCFAAQPAVVGHATSPWTAGTLFIADQGLHNGNDGAVYSLAPGGSPSTIAAGTITDVNADSAGNVYYTDCNNGKAWEYMPS